MSKFLFLLAGVLVFSMALAPSPASGLEYTLDDLYRIARQRSERIRVTEENAAIARWGVDRFRAALVPNLSAFASYRQYLETKRGETGNILQPNSSGSWGLELSQSYSLSGREFTALKIAGDVLEKSRYDLVSFQQDYLLSVAAAFYDLLKAKQSWEIAGANLERLTKYRDAAGTRLRVGEATKTALLRAEGELSGAQSDKIRAGNAMEAAQANLARIVGLEEPFVIKETPDADNFSPSLDELEAQALARRLDLKSLEMQKKIAEQQVSVVKGAFWPSVSLGATYSRVDQYPQSTNFNRDTIYGNVALNFSFYDGGERKADVREAETRWRQADLLYRDAVKSVLLQVKNSYLDLTTQQGIIKFLEDQVVYASDNFNGVTKQYEFGLASSLDVIDANNLLLTSQRQLADAVNNRRYSLLNIKRVTGTLLLAEATEPVYP